MDNAKCFQAARGHPNPKKGKSLSRGCTLVKSSARSRLCSATLVSTISRTEDSAVAGAPSSTRARTEKFKEKFREWLRKRKEGGTRVQNGLDLVPVLKEAKKQEFDQTKESISLESEADLNKYENVKEDNVLMYDQDWRFISM